MTNQTNKAVAYQGPGKVEVQEIDYPTFELQDGPGVNPANVGRKVPATGRSLRWSPPTSAGRDQHMVRGRTTAPQGLVLGHEITGEVVEAGPDVEFIKVGDIVLGAVQHRLRPLPQLQGGQDRHLPERQPRPARAAPTATSTWAAGSAARPSTCWCPYADWNLLKFPDRDQAMEKILDLTMLSDIFPTGFHGASPPASAPGSTVYVAGAGPVGLAAAASARSCSAPPS